MRLQHWKFASVFLLASAAMLASACAMVGGSGTPAPLMIQGARQFRSRRNGRSRTPGTFDPCQTDS